MRRGLYLAVLVSLAVAFQLAAAGDVQELNPAVVRAEAVATPVPLMNYDQLVGHLSHLFQKFGVKMQHRFYLALYLREQWHSMSPTKDHHLSATTYQKAEESVFPGGGKLTASDVHDIMKVVAEQRKLREETDHMDRQFKDAEYAAKDLDEVLHKCTMCNPEDACKAICEEKIKALAGWWLMLVPLNNYSRNLPSKITRLFCRRVRSTRRRHK